jgi:RHS repeat-associated protein
VRHPGEPLDSLFADGFESGDFSPWTVYSANGDLSVTSEAALADDNGMQVVINDIGSLYVTDETPEGERSYYARFYFDPNSLIMNGFGQVQDHQIFQGYMLVNDVQTAIFRIHLRKALSVYMLDVYVRQDDGNWLQVAAYQLSDAVHAIEIEWAAASDMGANNGRMKLWVDNGYAGGAANVDNDGYRLDGVKLGRSASWIWGQAGRTASTPLPHARPGLGTLAGTHGCTTGVEGGESFLFEQGMAVALPLTDTLAITDTVLVTGTLPELEAQPLEALTVTLALSDSLDVTVLTETVEVTVTGVVSGTLFLVVEAAAVEAEPPPEGLTAVGEQWSHEVTIAYLYDPLQRLTEADYSDRRSFEYTYDAVGNRLSETVDLGPGTPIVTTYGYDHANRLTNVGAIPYEWDNNGNLLSVGATTDYTYSQANRLLAISGPSFTASMVYNGHGDRLSQTVNGQTTTYTLDLASGLTQVLADSAGNAYLYGLGRIGEEQAGGWQYHLGDALGSVRQLADANGDATLAKGYEPYGEGLGSAGSGGTMYGYTGEQMDTSGLVYLRARYYSPAQGRFMTRDIWDGDYNQPMSYNAWLYGYGNPINRIDPTGLCAENGDEACWGVYEQIVIRCPECALMVRATELGDLQLHQENIYYLQVVLDAVQAGWRPDFSVDPGVSIQQEASNFGVPWQVVAGVLESEIELDTEPLDYAETAFLNVAPWLANFHSNPGPGIGNVHVLPARNVAAYFSDYSCPGMRLYIFLDESTQSIAYKLTFRCIQYTCSGGNRKTIS